MKNLFTTYLFLTLIMASIVAPTFNALSENACEIELSEINEEEKKDKKVIDFEEVKIYLTSDVTSFYGYLALKNRISFFAKNYTSTIQNLDSPPPEFIA